MPSYAHAPAKTKHEKIKTDFCLLLLQESAAAPHMYHTAQICVKQGQKANVLMESSSCRISIARICSESHPPSPHHGTCRDPAPSQLVFEVFLNLEGENTYKEGRTL